MVKIIIKEQLNKFLAIAKVLIQLWLRCLLEQVNNIIIVQLTNKLTIVKIVVNYSNNIIIVQLTNKLTIVKILINYSNIIIIEQLTNKLTIVKIVVNYSIIIMLATSNKFTIFLLSSSCILFCNSRILGKFNRCARFLSVRQSQHIFAPFSTLVWVVQC